MRADISHLSTAQHSPRGVWYLPIPGRIIPWKWSAAPIPQYFLLTPEASGLPSAAFSRLSKRSSEHKCSADLSLWGFCLHKKKECICIPEPCLRNHEYSTAGFDARHRSGKGKGKQKVDRKNQCNDIHYHLVFHFMGGVIMFLSYRGCSQHWFYFSWFSGWVRKHKDYFILSKMKYLFHSLGFFILFVKKKN